MKILIAGGGGFLGKHLIKSLIADKHQVWNLSRSQKQIQGVNSVHWDGKTIQGGGSLMNEMDVVINLAGLYPLSKPLLINRRYSSKFLESITMACEEKAAQTNQRLLPMTT